MDRANAQLSAPSRHIVTFLWNVHCLGPLGFLPSDSQIGLKNRAYGSIIVMIAREARLSETDPIQFSPRMAGKSAAYSAAGAGREIQPITTFNRTELTEILTVYGRKVADGEWRDYALDTLKDRAVFSVFRRSAEFPIYRIEKVPKLARKQGAYSIVTATGMILKRGHELRRVLSVLEKSVRLVKG